MSASRPPPSPVYGPRPYPNIEGDQRGLVLTLSILFLVYTVMVVGMRLASKYRNMGIEDWVSIAGMVCTPFIPGRCLANSKHQVIALPLFISIMVAVIDGGFGSAYVKLSPIHLHTIAKVRCPSYRVLYR
jgi:hypothetical protein